MCFVMGRGIALALAGCLTAAGQAGCRDQIAGGRADGAAIFAEVCARCHGPVGVPLPTEVARLGVKPLTSDHVQRELTNADIRKQILDGSDNKQMPSFAGALSDAQIEAIVAHVRTLGAPP
jgi:mono/diheme cytochrome c family protein